jgi:hypothetical protein
MSAPPDPKHEGAIGAVTDVSAKLITALPAQFLVLILLNCVFLAVVLWFLNTQIDQRTAMVGKLMDRCMDIALHAPPPPER